MEQGQDLQGRQPQPAEPSPSPSPRALAAGKRRLGHSGSGTVEEVVPEADPTRIAQLLRCEQWADLPVQLRQSASEATASGKPLPQRGAQASAGLPSAAAPEPVVEVADVDESGPPPPLPSNLATPQRHSRGGGRGGGSGAGGRGGHYCVRLRHDHPESTNELIAETLAALPVQPTDVSGVYGPVLEVTAVSQDEADVQLKYGFRARWGVGASRSGRERLAALAAAAIESADGHGASALGARAADGEAAGTHSGNSEGRRTLRSINGSRRHMLLSAVQRDVEAAGGGMAELPGPGDAAGGLEVEDGAGALVARAPSALLQHSTSTASTASMGWELDPDAIELGRRLAVGGFAEVFVGRYLGTVVAVKILFDEDDATAARFSKEVALLCSLRHPNLILFMGFCTHPRLAIVAEYCARGSLFSIMRKRHGEPLEPRMQRNVAVSVARGMAYLHSRSPPLLHMDLKSPNLLVDERWRIKITDFGLSKLRQSTYLTAGYNGGTPEWMAPEVLRCERCDEKCDVFSYGVVLWELLTGLPPWEHLNPMQVVGVVGYQGRSLPLPEQGDPLLVQLCAACMRHNPADRPSFADILEAFDGERASVPGGSTTLTASFSGPSANRTAHAGGAAAHHGNGDGPCLPRIMAEPCPPLPPLPTDLRRPLSDERTPSAQWQSGSGGGGAASPPATTAAATDGWSAPLSLQGAGRTTSEGDVRDGAGGADVPSMLAPRSLELRKGGYASETEAERQRSFGADAAARGSDGACVFSRRRGPGAAGATSEAAARLAEWVRMQVEQRGGATWGLSTTAAGEGDHEGVAVERLPSMEHSWSTATTGGAGAGSSAGGGAAAAADGDAAWPWGGAAEAGDVPGGGGGLQLHLRVAAPPEAPSMVEEGTQTPMWGLAPDSATAGAASAPTAMAAEPYRSDSAPPVASPRAAAEQRGGGWSPGGEAAQAVRADSITGASPFMSAAFKLPPFGS